MTDLERTELERTLEDIGGRLDCPEVRHLSAAVRARLLASPPRSVRTVYLGRRRLRAALVALVLVVSATFTLWSPARRAVAQLLGLGGVRITRQEAPGTPGEGRLPLGEEVGVEEARRRAAFPVRLPERGGLGEPDQVFFDAAVPDGLVSLVYRPDSELPEIGRSGVGLVLSQFRGRLEAPLLTKFVAGNGEVRAVSVNGWPGYWIAGPDHPVLFRNPPGQQGGDTLFLAASVLLWEVDGLTLRLESALSLEASLQIARSTR